MQLNLHTSVPGWAATGSCYLCRTVHETRAYADTGIDIVGEGGLVICNQCVGELARAFGFVHADEYKDVDIELADLRTKVEALTEKAAIVNDLVAVLNVRPSE